MNILLSNDDGVYAPGLKTLYEYLSQNKEDDLTVVGPDQDRSAAGKSLTLTVPLRVRTLENGFISVNGTPTDCVHIALTDLLKKQPDMVIAGINAGANLGDDVLYSGTVSVATEGRFLGYPTIAVSLVSEAPQHYETAAKVVVQVLAHLKKNPLPKDTILNINVPDVPFEQIKGIKVCRLGQRHLSEQMIKTKDPRGAVIYWIGPPGDEQDAGPGTDFHAIREGYASLTPLQVDLTRYSALDSLTEWSKDIRLTT